MVGGFLRRLHGVKPYSTEALSYVQHYTGLNINKLHYVILHETLSY